MDSPNCLPLGTEKHPSLAVNSAFAHFAWSGHMPAKRQAKCVQGTAKHCKCGIRVQLPWMMTQSDGNDDQGPKRDKRETKPTKRGRNEFQSQSLRNVVQSILSFRDRVSSSTRGVSANLEFWLNVAQATADNLKLVLLGNLYAPALGSAEESSTKRPNEEQQMTKEESPKTSEKNAFKQEVTIPAFLIPLRLIAQLGYKSRDVVRQVGKSFPVLSTFSLPPSSGVDHPSSFARLKSFNWQQGEAKRKVLQQPANASSDTQGLQEYSLKEQLDTQKARRRRELRARLKRSAAFFNPEAILKVAMKAGGDISKYVIAPSEKVIRALPTFSSDKSAQGKDEEEQKPNQLKQAFDSTIHNTQRAINMMQRFQEAKSQTPLQLPGNLADKVQSLVPKGSGDSSVFSKDVSTTAVISAGVISVAVLGAGAALVAGATVAANIVLAGAVVSGIGLTVSAAQASVIDVQALKDAASESTRKKSSTLQGISDLMNQVSSAKSAVLHDPVMNDFGSAHNIINEPSSLMSSSSSSSSTISTTTTSSFGSVGTKSAPTILSNPAAMVIDTEAYETDEEDQRAGSGPSNPSSEKFVRTLDSAIFLFESVSGRASRRVNVVFTDPDTEEWTKLRSFQDA